MKSLAVLAAVTAVALVFGATMPVHGKVVPPPEPTNRELVARIDKLQRDLVSLTGELVYLRGKAEYLQEALRTARLIKRDYEDDGDFGASYRLSPKKSPSPPRSATP